MTDKQRERKSMEESVDKALRNTINGLIRTECLVPSGRMATGVWRAWIDGYEKESTALGHTEREATANLLDWLETKEERK